jgi:hypothetical protein
MTSRHEKEKKIDTPYLDVRYRSTDWPFATDPLPEPPKPKP